MSIEKCLTLSTAHMPDTAPYFGDIRSAPHQYGEIVFLASCDEQSVEPWFKDIYTFAVDQCCALVMFDSDADVIEGFKTYEW